MDKKLKSILALGQLQAETYTLFGHAENVKATGEYTTAHAIYQKYLAHSRSYLQAQIEFNCRFPEIPFDITPTAQTLVNGLMVDADLAQSLGEREQAASLRAEALEVSQAHLGRRGTAETERSRAAALTLEGRFNEAIVALMGARDVVMSTGDNLALARVTIDLADVLQWLGDLQRASEEIDHAASIIAPLVGDSEPTQQDIISGALSSAQSIMAGRGDPGDAMRAANLYRAKVEITYYRGLISRALGEWDKAERCFNQVLHEYRQLGTGEAIEWQLARVKVGRGEHRDALKEFFRIEPQFERGALRPKWGVLKRAQAECLNALGDHAEAIGLLGKSIEDLTHKHFDPDALWRSQQLQATIWKAQGESTLALRAYHEAIATISSLRRAPLGYRLDSTYLADKRSVYSQAIAAALQADAPADCCRFIENLKSRTLTAILSIPRAKNEQRGNLESAFDELTARLDALEYQAYRDGWRTELRSAYRDLMRQRKDLIERIRISDTRWRNLSQPIALDVGAIVATLSKRSQAALTLYYDAPELVSVLIYDGEIRAKRIMLAPEIPSKLADYARNLQKPNPDPFKHDFSVEYAIDAENLIPPDLLERALAARSLVVIPHGLLHLVPWGMLMHQGARLFERVPVGILPNLTVLQRDGQVSRPQLAGLVGVPAYPDFESLQDLPSIQEEIETIRSVYKAANIPVRGPLLGEGATEDAFWNLVRGVTGRGNLLHVSCHGVILPNEPMGSGLLLADAKLDAAEVARNQLPFDEVILSACSTGWRPNQVGDVILTADEILGIPAGFLEAGARTVLVSIPKAEARAALMLTTYYHQQRASSIPPIMAFQAAQRHMLERSVPSSTWAGFALYSDV
ncbi:MAG: CHAT domain-containing protein [Nitrospira sp.]|nr:CHAT domain-containing protein [Nitrospira sp.]